ncbi:MAG: hypothetical protein HY362_02095 [Candidatus Aenigmarchaeota archaeon]|nr:hypothetical protein [Candidatus Aenigmarchaeota archaeon]
MVFMGTGIDLGLPRTFIRNLETDERLFFGRRVTGLEEKRYRDRLAQGRDAGLYVPENPVITIGGTSGCGKGGFVGTLQYCLKTDYGLVLPVTTAGQFMREAAERYHFTDLMKFLEYCKENTEMGEMIDKEIDTKTLQTAITVGGIFDGRLAPLVAGRWGLRTLVKVPDVGIIGQRISMDDNRPENRERKSKRLPNITPEEATLITVKRDSEDIARYGRFYGIEDFRVELERVATVVVDNSANVERRKRESFRDAFMRSDAWTKFYKGVTGWLEAEGFVE